MDDDCADEGDLDDDDLKDDGDDGGNDGDADGDADGDGEGQARGKPGADGVRVGALSRSMVGTEAYMAPEV